MSDARTTRSALGHRPAVPMARYVVAAMVGFVLAAAATSAMWWGVAGDPDPDVADEVLAVLAPDADTKRPRLTYDDSLRTGPAVLEVDATGLEPAAVATRAREAGWSVQSDQSTRVVVQSGSTRVTATGTRLVIDPHRSVWPGVAQGLAGVAGAALLATRVRANAARESIAQRRRRRVLAAGLALPVAAPALAVLVFLVARFEEHPDSAAAALGAVWVAWWLMLPIGAAVALFMWAWTGRTAGYAATGPQPGA